MAASGDYGYFQRLNHSKNTNVNLATGDAGLAGVVTVKNANYQVYVQKITYNPITVAAQAVTFRDSAGTPINEAVVPASQTTPIVFDFGPEGTPLTVGKNLDISNTAGPAARIHIEAYQKLATVISSDAANQ